MNIATVVRAATPRLCAALLLLAGAATLHAETARPPVRRAPPVAPALPRAALAEEGSKEGRAALSAASSAKRAAQKLEGDERDSALADVASQYAGIAATEAFTAGERAEAAFRGGEILRTLDQADAADGQFARAVALGEETETGREFAGRGLLERAHLKRRSNDGEAALALYAEVARRFGDQRRSAAHARTWSGKLLLKSGQLDEAAQKLLGFAEAYPEFATEAVRNADLLAVAQAEAGDESSARATIERLRRELEPVMAKGDKAADEVQVALDNLRVTEILGGY
jgi:hypothetical protein